MSPSLASSTNLTWVQANFIQLIIEIHRQPPLPLNLIAGLQLKSEDARFPRSHFPDVSHRTWKEWSIMRNNWQRWDNETFLQTNAAIQLWKRPYCPQRQSFLAPAAKHQYYFALLAVLNTTERLQGSNRNAQHSTLLGNLDLNVPTESTNEFLLWDISNFNRFESSFLKCGQQSAKGHWHKPLKRRLITGMILWGK